MKISPNSKYTFAVFLAAIATSIGSYAYFFHLNVTNIYGDGLYHLNTARKMMDSALPTLWERYAQLGSPWLPLPHILMLPLIGKDEYWRTGFAGSAISMISFIIASVLIYKLSLRYYADRFDNPQAIALVSACIFLLNPSNLYMQSTPMTELPFMVLFVASIYTLQKWALDHKTRWLAISAVLMTLGTITRYEGWALLPFAGITVLLASDRISWRKLLDGALWGLIVMVGPIYWFWHNWAIYGNPLEFYNGPYSAHGIYKGSNGTYDWVNVSYHNLKGSFLIASVTTILCLTLTVFLLAVSGYLTELFQRFVFKPQERKRFVIDGYLREFIAKRREWSRFLPTFLLVVPFCFFVYSLYKNEIQVIPLSMLSLYNVRYGLMHLIPAAVFAPAVIFLLKPQRRNVALAILALLIFAQYGLQVYDGATRLEIVQEPIRNNVNSPEWKNKAKLDEYLRNHPPQAPILMESGYLGSSILRGGLLFKNVIYDGDSRFHEIIKDEIPSNIPTVVMKDGDELWQRFHDDSQFNRQFEPAYTTPGTPTLIVYRRKP